MISSNPGFVGQRLTEAREVRMISGKSLADSLEVSASSISQYENGKQTPGDDVLNRMADSLRFPTRFFFGPEREGRAHTTFFRSLKRDSKASQRAAWWRLQWQHDLTEYLDEYLELPINSLPDLGFTSNPNVISDEQIEDAAMRLRQCWKVGHGAISNLLLLAERNGVVISRYRLFAQDEDALSEPLIGGKRDYVLLNADKGAAVRSRFDLAHELGHLVMHRNVSADSKRENHKLIEKQANLFAGALLLPWVSFSRDFMVPTLDVFVHLKPKWKTSVGAMIMRCKHRGIIDKDEQQSLFRKYRYRSWHLSEPLDDELEVEQPQLLHQCMTALLELGIQTRGDICRSQVFLRRDVEEICNLPFGFLHDSLASKFDLNLKPRNN